MWSTQMSRSPVLRTDQVQGFHLHPSHMSAGRGRLLSHVLHRLSRGRTLRRVPGAIFKAAEALNKIFKQCLTLQITLPRFTVCPPPPLHLLIPFPVPIMPELSEPTTLSMTTCTQQRHPTTRHYSIHASTPKSEHGRMNQNASMYKAGQKSGP